MSLLLEYVIGRHLKSPEKASSLALVEEEERWTFAELSEKVNRLASVLTQQGIQPGDRVALMFLNQKEFLLSLFALLKIGAVAVPINIQLPQEDIIYVILNSGSRLVITTEMFAPHFEGKPIPVLVANRTNPELPSLEKFMEQGAPDFKASFHRQPHAMSVLIYTSGSTGKPKGVMLSEENFLANMEGIAEALHFNPDDRMLLALPLFHAYGLMIGMYGLALGGEISLVPNFAPKKIIKTIIEERITILPLVPTMFSVVLEGIQRAGVQGQLALKYCVSGGASLPHTLLKRIEEELNIKVLEGYGLTETAPVLAVNRPDRGGVPYSVGKPLFNVSIKLEDAEGHAIPWQLGEESAEGEILVKGPNVMAGYYHLPEETALAFDAEGWLRTGDIGRFDAEGNLYISGGRKKDLIIKAGENISPVRIEQALYQHPAVKEASVIGVPDPKLGEEIVACVQFKEGQSATETDLKKFCREHLTSFMVPAEFRFYEELPKSPAGKILKTELRSHLRSPSTLLL